MGIGNVVGKSSRSWLCQEAVWILHYEQKNFFKIINL